MILGEDGFDPGATALSAIENASRAPARREDLRRMLSTGAGDPSHLRALFGDVDLHTLTRLAALFGVENETLARSYVRARAEVAAANAELDEFAAQFDL
jgi:hypothetical protein